MTTPARIWVEAARPRTLPAAITPVLVGTAAADRLVPWRFAAALVVALALQVAVNLANDHFDAAAGIDTAARTGPRRAVASGLVTPAAMLRATFLALAVAAVAGLALAVAVGWELLLVGLAAGLAALGYSGGAKPYASRGLGEVAVFVFFGVVATVGSQYVQDGTVTLVAVVASVPVGLVAVALLVVNNLRDIPTDEATGKRTLAVRVGATRTRQLYATCVGTAAVLIGVVAWVAGSFWPLLAWLAAPFVQPAVRTVRLAPLGRELVPALEATGRYHLLAGILLAVGLAIA